LEARPRSPLRLRASIITGNSVADSSFPFQKLRAPVEALAMSMPNGTFAVDRRELVTETLEIPIFGVLGDLLTEQVS
jgi:hypothetical protein